MADFEGLVVRGLLSVWLTRGPENLTDEINGRWPGSVEITDHGWAWSWFSNVPWIYSQCLSIHARGKKIALIGHSFGGTAIIMVAEQLRQKNIPVDLLMPLDPAYQYATNIPTNVKRCVTFVQHTPGQLGQGELHPDRDWTTVAWKADEKRTLLFDTHIGLIEDPVVHAAVIAELGKL